jgi:hypothetical protein
MQIKYVVCCYIQHFGHDPYIRTEAEFVDEPTYDQIKETLDAMPIYDSDSEIDYSTGAVLPDYSMPRKSRIQRIYSTVEKRFYREVPK